MRVLVAEQNVLVARAISLALTAAGFIVDYADLGDDAFEMVRHFEYDAVLLAAEMPVLSGIAVLQLMRHHRRAAPVIILNANADLRPRGCALEASADDVVATTIDPEELVARLHAVIRRARGLGSAAVQIGALAIDFAREQITCHGEPVRLSNKEFAVLELLVLCRGRVLTRDAFMNHLYAGMNEPEVKIVDVFVCKLRKKLQQAGISDLIVNVRKQGYMLREGRAVLETLPRLDRPTAIPHQASPTRMTGPADVEPNCFLNCSNQAIDTAVAAAMLQHVVA